MANKKRTRKKKPYNQRGRRGKGSANATAMLTEEVRVDFGELPADLTAEDIDELIEALEKARPKRKPKAMSHSDLQALPFFELAELAEAEGIEVPANMKRRELIFSITRGRLERHVPVTVQGCLEISAKGHAFLRCPHNSYLADYADPVVPMSVLEHHGMKNGMTVEGLLRVPKEGEKYFAVTEVTKIDNPTPRRPRPAHPSRSSCPCTPRTACTSRAPATTPSRCASRT